ncbi:MAG: 50S ribosomal protein L5 [Parcubacteria group bacterium]|nr:50S ribosomal protein L5 [Parcubacteria group bacterium]
MSKILNYKEKYQKEVIPKMKETFRIKNDWGVPQITKVVINVGIGRLIVGSKNQDDLVKKISQELAMITGQKPAIRPAKKSISSFKIREGMPVGLMITLRGKRKEDFIDKFINLVLPQVRDFWGIPLKNIDEHGNLNYGLKDYSVFPEIVKGQTTLPFGLEITFVTNAKNREQAIKLYQLLNFPLQKD